MMVRRLTVLIALLAQGLASMSPACLVRCVAPNGHECVELVGQDCHGCEQGLSQHSHPSTSCCEVHSDAVMSDDAETLLTSQEECGCLHSPLDFGPQSPVKSLTAEPLSNSQAIWQVALPIISGHVASLNRADFSSPQISPHLGVLATVVLRV